MTETQAFVLVLVILASICVGVGITQWLYGHRTARDAKRAANHLSKIAAHAQSAQMSLATIAQDISEYPKPTNAPVMPALDGLLGEIQLLRGEVAHLRRIEPPAQPSTPAVASTPVRAAEPPEMVDRLVGADKTAEYRDSVGRVTEEVPETAPAPVAKPKAEPRARIIMSKTTGMWHTPDCRQLKIMKANNQKTLHLTKQEVLNLLDQPGKKPCGHCLPLNQVVS